MKRPMVALICAVLLLAGRAFAEDTGTYRILDYRVALTPHSDGTVAIDYYQKWLVTGGHIPWISVGTANADFDITGSGRAAVSAESASGGGWSGVRLDLDRDYRPGETFEVLFSIVQRRLFYAEKERYRLDFTPGWYDRAVTDTLRIAVVLFAKPDSVAAGPPPTFISNDTMVWIKRGLSEGERFSVTVAIPVTQFPGGIAQGNLKRSGGGGNAAPAVVFGFIALFVFIMIVRQAARSARRGYSGGRMYYGGIFGGGAGGRGGRSTGGGGGFGGSSISCACACVSCACACACAGGGGAGCSRKLEHSCPACGKPAAV